MVFNPLLDADDATLQTHVRLADAESAFLEVQLAGIEQEIDIADADVLADTVHLNHGIAQDEVGGGIPLVEEVRLGFVLLH